MPNPHAISQATAAAVAQASANTAAAALATASVLAANAAAIAAAKAGAADLVSSANSHPARPQLLQGRPSEHSNLHPHSGSIHAQLNTKPSLSPSKDAVSLSRSSGAHVDPSHTHPHDSHAPKVIQLSHLPSSVPSTAATTPSVTAEEQQRLQQKGLAALGSGGQSVHPSHQASHAHTHGDGASAVHQTAPLHVWGKPSLPLHTSNSPHILTMADVAAHGESARNLHHQGNIPHTPSAASAALSADLAAADMLTAHLATLARLTSNSRAHVHHVNQKQQLVLQQQQQGQLSISSSTLQLSVPDLHIGAGVGLLPPNSASASLLPSATAQRSRQDLIPRVGGLMPPTARPQQQHVGVVTGTASAAQTHQHLRQEPQQPQQRRFSTSDATQPPQVVPDQHNPAPNVSWGAHQVTLPPSATGPHLLSPTTTAASDTATNRTLASTQHSAALPHSAITGKDHSKALSLLPFPPFKQQTSNGQHLPGYKPEVATVVELQATLVNLMQEIHKQQQQQQRGASAGAALLIPPYLPLPPEVQKHIRDVLHNQQQVQHSRPASQPNPASSQPQLQQRPASSQSQSEGAPVSGACAISAIQGEAENVAKDPKAQLPLQQPRLANGRPDDILIPSESGALKSTGVWG